MLVAWVLFPLLLAALALGCGLLLEAVGGVRLRGALLAPAGLALAIVAGQLTTLSDATAELTVPVVVALAATGIALSSPGRLRELDGWAIGTAVAAFAVFAAPVVLSGQATFAGFERLDDTSIWLANTDWMMDHGRNLSNLPSSGYKSLLENYLGAGYPIGSFLPLGIGHKVLGWDSAWLFQPTLAFSAAMLALAIYTLAEPLVPSRPLRALVAFIAPQPALLYGYSLWGGIKEMAAVWVLVALAALLVPVLAERARAPRLSWAAVASLVPAAVASAAALSVLSAGGVLWIIVPLAGTLALLVWLRGSEQAFVRAGIFAAIMLLLSVPPLVQANAFFDTGHVVLTSGSELGILGKPLSTFQVLGIWPASDPRADPSLPGLTYFLLVVLMLAAVGGLALAILRRAWGPLLYLSGAATGCLIVAALGSPWVDGKAFAIASPAFLLAALLGVAAALDRWMPEALSGAGVKALAAAVALALSGGVLWSNVLAYRGVNLAPRDRLGELEQIGKSVEGEGPTLTTDLQRYAADHFLRNSAPTRITADVDRLGLATVLQYRTIVVRRSPIASRPPSPYRLTYRGRFYEAWQRPKQVPRRVLQHLSLGSRLEPTARPLCDEVRGLAAQAGRRGALAAVERPPAIVLADLPALDHPPNWRSQKDIESATRFLVPSSSGTLGGTVNVLVKGNYGIWIGGAWRGVLDVRVDGRSVISRRHRLNPPGFLEPMGATELSAGRHRLTLRYTDRDWHPGSAGEPFPIGPIALSRSTAERPVTYVRPSSYRTLCSKRLDWVEALGS